MLPSLLHEWLGLIVAPAGQTVMESGTRYAGHGQPGTLDRRMSSRQRTGVRPSRRYDAWVTEFLEEPGGAAYLANPSGTRDALKARSSSTTPSRTAQPLYPGTRLTDPAVLDYSSVDDQEPPKYLCLTEHVGA
ncbi:hypothetical protein ACWEBX_31775 [Streptomyces sp. NPDC005070]